MFELQQQTAELNGEMARSILQGHFDEMVTKGRFNNALMAVETVDGSFSWVGAHGLANTNGDPITAETPIWMASVTKMYIAAVVLKLQEEGQLSIEKPLSEYLPVSFFEGIHQTSDGEDHTHKITIKHLLGHASGLPDYLIDHPEGEKGLLDQVFEDEDKAWSVEDALNLIRNRLPAHFPPQEMDNKKVKVYYSDTNYQLLISIIESVTGLHLSEAFNKYLFQPLGLNATFLPGKEKANDLPNVAEVWNGDKRLNIPAAMRSFGDLNSTVGDMVQFMRGLIRSEIYNHPETGKMMYGTFHKFGFSLDASPKSPTWPIAYGLGMAQIKMPLIFSLFIPIPEVIGHTGVSGSWIFFCPKYDLIIAGTVNQIAAASLPYRFVPRMLGDRDWQKAFE